MSKPRPKQSTFEQRVQWLEDHRHLEGQPKLRVLRLMQEAGLFAPSTYLLDCKLHREFLVAKFRVEEPKP